MKTHWALCPQKVSGHFVGSCPSCPWRFHLLPPFAPTAITDNKA